jgi:membrane protein YqaA with SNARE-associated domain
MKLFSSIYQKVMDWSKHRLASYWLALVSFTESSFFIIPPDVMLAPMSLAKPGKAWFYAGLTTIASVLGGLLGYVIGAFAIEMITPWLYEFGYFDAYQLAQAWFVKWGFWAIFMAGFTPVPYKVFTIAAGAAAMALVPFVLGSLVGRGCRFFLVAGLMCWGGADLEKQLSLWVDRLGWAMVVAIIGAYFIWFH